MVMILGSDHACIESGIRRLKPHLGNVGIVHTDVALALHYNDLVHETRFGRYVGIDPEAQYAADSHESALAAIQKWGNPARITEELRRVHGETIVLRSALALAERNSAIYGPLELTDYIVALEVTKSLVVIVSDEQPRKQRWPRLDKIPADLATGPIGYHLRNRLHPPFAERTIGFNPKGDDALIAYIGARVQEHIST